MSRCFPYPPPGYTLSRADEDALIESIKLQKERAKAKEQRKKRKEEKKEKRKEKKEKRKEKKERKEKAPKNLDKYNTSKELHAKCSSVNNEQLEKSGLTEEHGRPICLGSTSSDSTENSNKRKRHSPSNVGSHFQENVIRIRLSSNKQCETVPNALITCSTFERTDDDVQSENDIFVRGQETFCCPSEYRSSFGLKELSCSTSGKSSNVASGGTGMPSAPDLATNAILKQELLLRKLIDNLVLPQPLDAFIDPHDLDWLFNGKNQGGKGEKRLKPETDSVSCSSISSLWQPRPRRLPEVDVCALPYVIPF